MTSSPVVDTVRVGNSTWGWGSVAFSVDGHGTEGITSIDYDEQLETRTIYSNAQSGLPLGMSIGRYKVTTFPLRMLRDSALALKQYLTGRAVIPASLSSPSGSYGVPTFTLQLQLSARDASNGVPTTIAFSSCRILGEKAKHEEGTGVAVTEFRIGCLAITQDGSTLYTDVPPTFAAFPEVDSITINGVQPPGKWSLVRCDRNFGWQIQQPGYMSGGSVVPIGDPLCEPEFMVEIWDPVDYAQFRTFRSVYLSKPALSAAGAPTAIALGVDHPELKDLGIAGFVVKSITPMAPDGFGVWSGRVTFLQYRKPRIALSRPNAVAPDQAPPKPVYQTETEKEIQRAQQALGM